jgi:tetratricopeptide (TPR) repeat protein
MVPGKNIALLLTIAAALAGTVCSCGFRRVEISDYHPVIRSNPSAADSLFNRGIAMEILDRDDEAASLFRESARLDPGDPDAWYELGTMLSGMGRDDETRDAFSRALALRPTNPKHAKLGLAYFSTGRYAEAAGELNAALSANEPGPATLAVHLGTAYQELGRYEDALNVFSSALKINSELVEGYYNVWFSIGVCLQSLGRNEDAADAYRTSIRYRPDIPETLYNLAVLSLSFGDRKTAMSLRDSLATISPGAAKLLDDAIQRGGSIPPNAFPDAVTQSRTGSAP